MFGGMKRAHLSGSFMKLVPWLNLLLEFGESQHVLTDLHFVLVTVFIAYRKCQLKITRLANHLDPDGKSPV